MLPNSSRALYLKLASTQLGTLVVTHSYHAMRRLIEVDGDDVAARGDDPLGARLVAGIKALPSKERSANNRDQDVEPSASLAALFQDHAIARSLRPRLYVGLDLSGDGGVCAMMTTCEFTKDRALSTTRLTQQYCAQHGLPRLDTTWVLVDVVASAKQGSAGLLLLQTIVAAARAKRTGIVSIAVTNGGRNLFQTFGFQVHGFREKGSMRYVAHARLSDITLADVHKRLRVHQSLLTDTCVRSGLTGRSARNLIGRC